MKYEYLCGHESDFFTMPAEVIAVVRLDYCVQGLTEFSQIVECGKPVLAMRRIIKEPKHWTREDKKAGRLPEVGAKCKDRSFLFKVINVTDKYVVIETMQSGDVYSLTHHSFMSSCDPIETPAEKAQREEDEFIRSLAGTDIHCGTGTVKELFDQGARAAYRKLKGGE